MSKEQTGMLWLISGLIMLMGTLGGVEQTPDLLTWDGIWLAAFTVIGISMMALGASLVNGQTDENQGRCL